MPERLEQARKLILYPNVHVQKSIMHSLKMAVLCNVDSLRYAPINVIPHYPYSTGLVGGRAGVTWEFDTE